MRGIALLALFMLLSCAPASKPPASGAKEAAQKPEVKLPPGAIPLSAVLKSVDSAGYGPVTEVEFEDGAWQVKAHRNGDLFHLKVDPLDGRIVPTPPPAQEKPLAEIVKSLEDQGYGPFLDAERSAGDGKNAATWEVEAYKGVAEVALRVDAVTGKVTLK